MARSEQPVVVRRVVGSKSKWKKKICESWALGLFEPLENRVLLTTLVGGDTFDYLDISGKTIRVTLTGNAIIELIAGAVDTSQADQPLLLGNMPGELSGDRVWSAGVSAINVYGGLGGADAIRVIGPTSFTNPQNGAYNSSNAVSSVVEAIATSLNSSLTWGINIGNYTIDGSAKRTVNLIGVDISQSGSSTDTSGTSAATLQESTLRDDVLAKAQLNGKGANFVATAMSNASTIYAINIETASGATVAVLYEFDVNSGAQLRRAELTNTSTGTRLYTAASMAFDDAGNLYFTTVDYDGLSTVDTSGYPSGAEVPSSVLDPGLVNVSTASGTFGQFSNQNVSLITGVSNGNNYEITYDLTGLVYNSSKGQFTGAASGESSASVFSLSLTGQGKSQYGDVAQITGSVSLTGAANVHGLAYSQNINNQTMLVTVVGTAGGSYLASINASSGDVRALSSVGSVSSSVLSLTSATSTGDSRPMIYTIDGSGQIVRGSTVSLPVGVDGATTVISSQASALDESGELYFVTRDTHEVPVNENGTITIVTVELDSLYHVNTTLTGSSVIQNSLGSSGSGHFGESVDRTGTVHGLAFDDDGNLWAFITRDATENATESGVLAKVSLTTSATSGQVAVTLAGEKILEASGIAFVPSADGVVYITTGTGTGSRLIRTNLSDGMSLSMGLLTDPTLEAAEGQNIAGQNIGDLTWNPYLVDPFTNELGALVAVDTGTGQLIFIDRRLRFSEASLFTIYVAQTDGNAVLTITEVVRSDSGDVSTPYTGSTGSIAIRESNIILSSDDIYTEIEAPENSGSVFIGAKGLFNVSDANGDVIEERLNVAYLSAFLSESIGVRAAGIDDFLIYRDPESAYYDPSVDGTVIAEEDNITPGVVVGESLLEFVGQSESLTDNLMGAGFGEVVELSANSTGEIYAVSMSTGEPVIGLVDGNGHVAESSVKALTYNGAAISTVFAMDYGDIRFTGSDTLYAVVRLTNDPDSSAALVTVNTATGEVSLVGMLGTDPVTGLAITSVSAMAVSSKRGSLSASRRGMYIVVGSTIIEIDPTSGAVVSGQYAKISSSDGLDFQVASMDFDQFNQLMVIDSYNGRLADIDLSTMASHAVVLGADVVTEAGSVRPTVASLTFDLTRNQYLGADNATTLNGSTIPAKAGQATRSVTVGSAALMTFNLAEGASSQDLGTLLIDGTVTGRLDFSGSVGTIYVGWLITGNATGNVVSDYDRSEASVQLAANVLVRGDLGNLLVGTSLGTDGTSSDTNLSYYTGTDIVVMGRAGVIKALGTFAGSLDVQNNDTIAGSGLTASGQEASTFDTGTSVWTEVETQNRYLLDNAGIAFWEGRINNSGFYNDSIESAQYLGTLRSDSGSVIEVSGVLQSNLNSSDTQDHYAISLMAGQTVTVYTTSSIGVSYVVYDPDGRMITSDASYSITGDDNATQIRFTADRPGTYTIGVIMLGSYEDPSSASHEYDIPYVLWILNAGDVALASLAAGTNAVLITGSGSTQLWGVRKGDLGSITAGEKILTEAMPDYGYTINIADGNLRSMVAGSIGDFSGIDPFESDSETSPFLNIPSGGVGLIQSTGGDIRLNMNNFNLTNYGSDAGSGISIGGNYQTIAAEGNLAGSIYSRAGIGVIRAGSVDNSTLQSGTISSSYLTPFEIVLNTDNVGSDGIIDLISVSGDWGNLTNGGGGITTGVGGNVRYMTVGGTLWGDRFFGATSIDPAVSLSAGQSYQFKDDSGNILTLTPTGNTSSTDSSGNTTNSYQSLTILAYGIRGSGGSVLVELTTTGGVTISGAGGEVSSITIQGTGASISLDGNNQLVSTASSTGGASLSVTGTGTIDIWKVTGDAVDTISNTTGGEIVNVSVGSIVTLYSAGTLGLARSTTGAEVNGIDVFDNTFPFVDQRYGIRISGDAINIRSNLSMGNIIVTGMVTNIQANYDRVNTSGDFEGIVGAIVLGTSASGSSGDATTTVYQAQTIDIGEGLAPMLAGTVGNSGIFSSGALNTITSTSQGSIWGPIVAQGGIKAITLSNGSIISAFIGATSEFSDAIVFDNLFVINTSATIGNITLTGNGGIIGSTFLAGVFNNVTVNLGYGIIASYFGTIGQGVLGNFSVDGLGIRYSTIEAGENVGNITATGTGQLLNIASYSAAVRQSQLSADVGYNGAVYDPTFNVRLTGYNDLLLFQSQTGSSSNAGLIDYTLVMGNRNLGTVSADRITNSEFNFANYIAGIVARSKDTSLFSISGVDITTGELRLFSAQGDLNDLDLTVAGTISTITIQGSLLGGSRIAVIGPAAKLGTVTIKNNLEGEIYANGPVTSINIGGSLTGNITIDPSTTITTALGSLTIGGSWVSGAIDITGNVNTITIGGSFGTVGQSVLVIDGNLGTLSVGKKTSTGSTAAPSLGASLQILGKATTITVDGQIEGAIVVRESLASLIVNASRFTSLAGTSILDSTITAGGAITTITVTGGSIAGVITGGNAGIRTFTLTGGSFLSGGGITSGSSGIGTITLNSGTFLDDSFIDTTGAISSLRILGTGALSGDIAAGSIGTMTVAGGLASSASISTTDLLSSLTVSGSVANGALLSFGSLGRLNVTGDLLGSVAAGYSASQANITVNNLAGQIQVGGDAAITVKGNIFSGAQILVGEDINQLAVAGAVGGVVEAGASATQINAVGYIRSLSGGSLTNTVITAGYDITSLRVAGSINSSLVQAGIAPGEDGTFSASSAEKDSSEQSRNGSIGTLIAADVINSIIAAGGSINAVNIAGTVRDSSISSGVSLGSYKIREVIQDISALSTGQGRASLRTGADRVLFSGNINSVRIGNLIGGDVTAGVDAGSDGIYGTADDSSLLINGSSIPYSGGTSRIGSYVGVGDSSSHVLADAGVGGNPKGMVVNANVTYDINILGELGTLVRTITSTDKSVTIDGVTITLTGPGKIEVYDNHPGDNSIDTLVISGTKSATQIKVTSTSGASVGRIVAEDDAVVGTLNAAGVTITGDVEGALADLWIEGANTVSLGTLGNDLSGAIAGRLTSLSIKEQQTGLLRVDGAITSVSIGSSTGYAIEGEDEGVLTGSGTVTGAAIDLNGTGSLFYIRSGRLISVGTPGEGQTQSATLVIDSFTGASVTGIDLTFSTAGTTAVAVAYSRSYAPSVASTASLNQLGLSDLRSLAVDSSGQSYAVATSGAGSNARDVLVKMDADGTAQVVGVFQDAGLNTFSGEVVSLAFNDSGSLYAIIHYGADFDDADRAGLYAIAKVSTTPVGTGNKATVLLSNPGSLVLLPALLSLGYSTENHITAMAIEQNTGTVYAVLRDDVLGQDTLVTVSLSSGQVTQVGSGSMQVSGASTHVLGIGFDDSGNLLALNLGVDGKSIIGLAKGSIGAPGAFEQVTVAGSLAPDLTSFATGKGALAGTTYGYDDGSGSEPQGRFYTGTGTTLVATVGLLQTQGASVGKYTAISGITGIDGQLISQSVVSIAVIADAWYVALSDGQLLKITSTGTTVAQAQLYDGQTGKQIVVSDLYVSETGVLMALDATNHRIVFVDIGENIGQTRAKTQSGSLSSAFEVVALNTLTGELWSYNSSTGSDTYNHIVELRGSNQSDLGGLTASSISSLKLTSVALGRVASTSGAINTASFGADFTGLLSADTTVGNVKIAGAFSGVVYASLGVGTVGLSGSVGTDATVESGGWITTINQTGSGNFAGSVVAASLGSLRTGGDFTGSIYTQGSSGSMTVAGDFAGSLTSDGISTLNFSGSVGNGARIVSYGTIGSVTAKAGLLADALIYADGKINTINIQGTTQGMIIANGGFGTATFQTLDQAIITLGADSGTLRVTGNTSNAIISIGTVHQKTSAEPEPVFNTSSDRIVGATLTSAVFQGNFTDSIIAAGVLPALSAGIVNPGATTALNLNAYLASSSYALATGQPDIGGPVVSRIGSVRINGLATSSSVSGGRRSLIVSADELGTVAVKQGSPAVTSQVYEPLSSLSVTSAATSGESKIRVVFNQTLNADSIKYATFVGDPTGTVLLTDSSGLLLDATITYTIETDSSGTPVAVLVIQTSSPLPADGYTLTIYGRAQGASLTGPAVSERAELTQLIELRYIGNGAGVDGGSLVLEG